MVLQDNNRRNWDGWVQISRQAQTNVNLAGLQDFWYVLRSLNVSSDVVCSVTTSKIGCETATSIPSLWLPIHDNVCHAAKISTMHDPEDIGSRELSPSSKNRTFLFNCERSYHINQRIHLIVSEAIGNQSFAQLTDNQWILMEGKWAKLATAESKEQAIMNNGLPW